MFDIEVPDVQLSGHVFEDGGKVPVVGATINVRPTQRRSYGRGMGDRSNISASSAFAACSPATSC